MTATPKDRTEALRVEVDRILRGQTDDDERRCGFVHLYGVAQAAALLAQKRGLDLELSLAAGMLHDIASYHTAHSSNHAARSAVMAYSILERSGDWAPDEIGAICTAISHHSDKGAVQSPLDELLKDADVLQHILYNPILNTPVSAEWQERLTRIHQELSLSIPSRS